MRHQVYLSLGSNIDPERNLPLAVGRLTQVGRVVAVSSVWETAPWATATPQPNFVNGCLLLETELTAAVLYAEVIETIETDLGRQRTGDRNAPRPIDIDIMLFDQEITVVGRRQLPDPEILERPFIALLLAEIAPDYVHPESGQTLAQLAQRFARQRPGLRRRDEVRRRILAAAGLSDR